MTGLKNRMVQRRGMFLRRAGGLMAGMLICAGGFAAKAAETGAAMAGADEAASGGFPLAALGGASAVIAFLGAALFAILTTRRLEGSSLFNRLFVVVAVTAGFFRGL